MKSPPYVTSNKQHGRDTAVKQLACQGSVGAQVVAAEVALGSTEASNHQWLYDIHVHTQVHVYVNIYIYIYINAYTYSCLCMIKHYVYDHAYLYTYAMHM